MWFNVEKGFMALAIASGFAPDSLITLRRSCLFLVDTFYPDFLIFLYKETQNSNFEFFNHYTQCKYDQSSF